MSYEELTGDMDEIAVQNYKGFQDERMKESNGLFVHVIINLYC